MDKDQSFAKTTIGFSPIYNCPTHGNTPHVIQVQAVRPDLDGIYCMICAVEKLVASGVCKVEPVR